MRAKIVLTDKVLPTIRRRDQINNKKVSLHSPKVTAVMYSVFLCFQRFARV